MCAATGADKNAAEMAECVQSSRPGMNPLNPCPGLVRVCKLSTRRRRGRVQWGVNGVAGRSVTPPDQEHAMHRGRWSRACGILKSAQNLLHHLAQWRYLVASVIHSSIQQRIQEWLDINQSSLIHWTYFQGIFQGLRLTNPVALCPHQQWLQSLERSINCNNWWGG